MGWRGLQAFCCDPQNVDHLSIDGPVQEVLGYCPPPQLADEGLQFDQINLRAKTQSMEETYLVQLRCLDLQRGR
jgi:hypothetical protein